MTTILIAINVNLPDKVDLCICCRATFFPFISIQLFTIEIESWSWSADVSMRFIWYHLKYKKILLSNGFPIKLRSSWNDKVFSYLSFQEPNWWTKSHLVRLCRLDRRLDEHLKQWMKFWVIRVFHFNMKLLGGGMLQDKLTKKFDLPCKVHGYTVAM